MSEYDTESFYRSGNMAMVTYLRMEGHAVQTVLWDKNTKTAYWVFHATPGLLEMTDLFSANAALVDPREYNREFAKTKSEFHSASRK